MRCKCCDKILSDSESTNKNKWGEYEDTCFRCLREAGIAVTDEYVERGETYEDDHAE